jgi:predicted component of type VI protein secretion system
LGKAGFLSNLGRHVGTLRGLVTLDSLDCISAGGVTPVNVRFVVTKPASKATTFRVQLPLLVGRSEEAKFRIQQDRVSRKHCEFFEQEGGVYLRDLGSTNGTFLNGELIETSAKVPLEPGAVVKIGSLEFRVEFDAAGPASVAPPAVEEAEADKTVGVAAAADSEHLQIEHAADPVQAPAEEAADESPAILTAERPATVDEAPGIEVAAEAAVAEAAPLADDAFGFLAGDNEAKPAPDDEQLGDFLKGLK